MPGQIAGREAVLSKDFPFLASSFFNRLFALESSFSSPIFCSRLLRQSGTEISNLELEV